MSVCAEIKNTSFVIMKLTLYVLTNQVTFMWKLLLLFVNNDDVNEK